MRRFFPLAHFHYPLQFCQYNNDSVKRTVKLCVTEIANGKADKIYLLLLIIKMLIRR